MSAEILTIPPTSGKFNERHFGEHFPFPVWVQFTDNNFEDWVGCFSRQYEGGLCSTLTNETNTMAFIIAGGEGYLIDINAKKVMVKVEDPSIESVIHTTNPDYFIAGTSHSIFVFNDNSLLEEIKPDRMLDGIYFKGQIGNKAFGELATAENQYEHNLDFDFDLITFELTLKRKTGFISKILGKH